MVEITQTKPLTLVLTLNEQDKQILLGWKKRGFGANMYNGFGGKLEKGETVLQAAHRELEEEAVIKARHLERVGLNIFTFENDPVALEVHVFRATEYEGTPTETEEMRPEWFAFDSIPYDQMWADDRQWMPLLLNCERFFGEYHFDVAGLEGKILKQNLRRVDSVPETYDIARRTI